MNKVTIIKEGRSSSDAKQTKFYSFIQNNSGGSFDVDESKGISETVVIEAESAQQANTIAEHIGLYFDGCDSGMDCDCCGDRWYKVDESHAEDVPSRYGEHVHKAKSHWFSSIAFVHYLDGKIEKVIVPKQMN